MSEEVTSPDEDELDPVEAVRRAVGSAEKSEFDDGHELKQLIKKANGVTLPEAGKFLLKALRAQNPPIRREGSEFLVEGENTPEATEKGTQREAEDSSECTETEDTGEDKPEEEKDQKEPAEEGDRDKDESDGESDMSPEEKAGENEGDDSVEEMNQDTVKDEYSDVPERLRELELWTVGGDATDSPSPDREDVTDLEGAVRRAEDSDGGSIGYLNLTPTEANGQTTPDSSIITVHIKGCLDGDELKERMPEMPLNNEYVEASPSQKGCQIPILGYEVPDWWEDTYLTEDEERGIEITTDGFVESTGKAIQPTQEKDGKEAGSDTVTVKRGSRVMDDWLARVRGQLTGENPLDSEPVPEADIPPVEGVKLTDEQVTDCLGHIDPDLPYPEWKLIGYSLLDNYDDEAEISKARRLFENWSQGGEKYDDGLGRVVRNISPDDKKDVNVGYLIHKACQNGWVWEAESEPDERDIGVDTDIASPGDGSETEREVSESESENRPRRGRTPEPIGIYGSELTEEDGHYRYRTDDGLRRVTNFTVETEACIEHAESGKKYLELTVHPQEEDEYGVLTEPKVFNTVERFKDEVVTGFTTRFDGDDGVLNDMRRKVIENPEEPTKGTGTVGLHSHSETPEFVTPEGTLTEEGWSENPETKFVERLTDFEHRWNVSPSTSPTAGDRSNEDDLKEILELLPEIRGSEKYLTVLGWFYASPMKPLIVEWSGEFPVLSVSGGTEGGKEAALRVLQRAFGTDGEPLYVDSETHSQLENLSSSRSVPVWYDGYHPSNIRQKRLDMFHDYCRKTTRCMEETAGKPNSSRDSYRMTAPVVVTGGKLEDPYLVRRSMVTEFETRTVEQRRESRSKYATLVGESYYGDDGELYHPDGLDLGLHAIRYYSWITSRDTEELRGVWYDCRKDAETVVRSRDIESLRGTELQGVRITLFGLRMYQTFAEEMGAEPVIDAKARGKNGKDETPEEKDTVIAAPENDD